MTIHTLMGPGGATEAKQDAILTALAASLTELQQKLEPGQEVALTPATLAALENVTAAVTGTVALDAPTLAALESVTATISNLPADYPDAAVLAAVQAVTAALGGTLTVDDGHPDPQLDALTNAQLRAAPVPVEGAFDIGNLPLDIFANLITGSRDNQVEVHYDDVNYASYLTITTAGGGSGGARVQANGQVRFSSGTATTGAIKAVTIDVNKYRPMHESYYAWTAAFLVAGAAGSAQRIGAFDDSNGVFIGYEGASLQITHRLSGVDTAIPRASWDDPCTGQVGSGYTRNGVPEALDPTKLNVFRLRVGWLGTAGFVLDVLSPDRTWVPLYDLKRPNQSDLPFFSNADLPITVQLVKTSGATNYTIATNCWAAGTTSTKSRLSDPITDRMLAETVRAVITGKTTGGGGAYVDVKVAPSGALVADVSGSTVSDSVAQGLLADIVALLSAPLEVTGPLTNAEMRAAPVIVDDGHPDPQLDALTNTQLRALDVEVAEATKLNLIPYAQRLMSNATVTPTAGKAIELVWCLIIPSAFNEAENLVTISMTIGGVSKNIYATPAVGRSAVFRGDVDTPVVITLENAWPVAVNLQYREV